MSVARELRSSGRKWWAIGMVVVALLIGGIYLISRLTAPTESAAAPVAAPVKAPAAVVAQAKVVPVRSASLSFGTAGQIAEVLVAESDRVEAGQPLVRLDATKQQVAVVEAEAGLRRAQAQLDVLKAGPRPEEVDAARAGVDAAQAKLSSVQSSGRAEDVAVARAQLDSAQAKLAAAKAPATSADIRAAQQAVDNAKIAVHKAENNYNAVYAANKKGGYGAPSKSDVDAAYLAVTAARNGRTAAQARLDALRAGPKAEDIQIAEAAVTQAEQALALKQKPYSEADVQQAQAELRKAEAQLKLVTAGARAEEIAAAEAGVASAEAAVDQARAALADAELKAPFAGVIAAVEARAGEQAAPGAPAIRLADVSSWQIETTDLTELGAVKLREGQAAKVTFDALPGEELGGTVTRVGSFGETKQGDVVYRAIVTPAQHDERLRWNMTASVSVELGE